MPADLVDSPINVVVQDRKNANLLIVGNDLGVWVSIDAAQGVDAPQGQSADGARSTT